jgi:hypothetical protein
VAKWRYSEASAHLPDALLSLDDVRIVPVGSSRRNTAASLTRCAPLGVSPLRVHARTARLTSRIANGTIRSGTTTALNACHTVRDGSGLWAGGDPCFAGGIMCDSRSIRVRFGCECTATLEPLDSSCWHLAWESRRAESNIIGRERGRPQRHSCQVTWTSYPSLRGLPVRAGARRGAASDIRSCGEGSAT